MNKPLFSICAIAKNEENTLPKLLSSLSDYKQRGGKVFLLDTGSTDKTVEIAKEWGCVVHEVGEKFIKIIDKYTANSINNQFIIDEEPAIVKVDDKLFDFAAARNYISSLAECDMICTLDCDEAYSNFNIDKINNLINDGWEKFEYQFIFAHDTYGRAAVQFVQSKFYDRRKCKWEGIVHEVLIGDTKTLYVNQSIILLEHWQEQGKGHRGNYLIGLSLDCYKNPDNDRNSHYLARELMYNNRPKSAIKEFERHITMKGWVAERAQSMIYMGDCYGKISKEPEKQLYWYHMAYDLDPKRREALIALAYFMKHNNNPHGVAAYAGAAMQIPWTDYYANNRAHYEHLPHELMYWAKGWMGDIPAAQEHILMALKYQPYNPDYLRDTKYYFEYADQDIKGWMTFPELTFLYETAKKQKIIIEVGSWKGRSTHALLSGCKDGMVYAVDTWKGSEDIRDDTSWMAEREDVFKVFQFNTRGFDNLKIVRKKSVEAAKDFENGMADMIFIDAGHDYKSVKEDIEAWLPKLKKGGLFCGHDYIVSWMSVIEAVDEKFGKPDNIADTIWQIDFSKKENIPAQIENKIEKNIFTFWLGEDMPIGIRKCIESQKIAGYNHLLVTLDNYPKDIEYVQQAVAAKKWVKAVDYLKMWYLNEYGGIVMDADMEVLEGRNFDTLLGYEMFAAKEENWFIGYSLVGAVKNHRLSQEYLKKVPKRFRGDDDLNFESSMEIFSDLVYRHKSVKILSPEYFFPYNHQTGKINVTANTISFHHFQKSWINSSDLLPNVSIIIPQLGREDGLKKCLSSIDKLYYPKHLIETIIIEGNSTVPEKMAMGLDKSSGTIICYAANDIEFTPYSLYEAVSLTDKYGLVAFNTGGLLPDLGNICEHFIIRKDFIDTIGGQIFDTKFTHIGVDNLLWAKANKLKQAIRCEKAIVHHYHFSRGGVMDEVYEKGWRNMESDRNKLKKLLQEI
jgi:glycosyltransferase involved in cell wall biosynthesis